jgi:hypothetical protein
MDRRTDPRGPVHREATAASPAKQDSAGKTLLRIGFAGAVPGMAATAAALLWPGPATGAIATSADAAILVGAIGLRRRHGGRLLLAAIVGLSASLVTGIASFGLPLVTVGPAFDVVGTLSWLGDAAAYAILGFALLRGWSVGRRRVAIVAGIGCLLRAGAALLLVAVPHDDSLVDPSFRLLQAWRVCAAVSYALVAIFFVATSRTEPTA